MLCVPGVVYPKIHMCFANILSTNPKWQALLLTFYRWGTMRVLGNLRTESLNNILLDIPNILLGIFAEFLPKWPDRYK